MATAQMVTDRETKLQTEDPELLGLQEEMLELDAGTAKVKKQLQLEFPPDSFFARPVVELRPGPASADGRPEGMGLGLARRGGRGTPPHHLTPPLTPPPPAGPSGRGAARGDLERPRAPEARCRLLEFERLLVRP